MVGEGINDGPALAAATVGFVLAQRASGTAIAVADVLLLRDNITGVPFCIAKSRQTTTLVLTTDLITRKPDVNLSDLYFITSFCRLSKTWPLR